MLKSTLIFKGSATEGGRTKYPKSDYPKVLKYPSPKNPPKIEITMLIK